jgi:hypothetical protein
MSTLRPEPAGSLFNETGQSLTFTVFPSRDVFTFEGQPTISATDGTLQFTLAPNQFGNVPLRVVLRDDGGLQNGGVDSFESILMLVVTPNNDPPSFEISRTEFVFDENAGEIRMPATARKISSGILEDCVGWNPTCVQQQVSFVVDDVSTVDLFTTLPFISSYGTMSFKLAPHETGTARVIVHLEDDGGARSASKEFFVTVIPVNDRPDFKLPWNVTCDRVDAVGVCTCPSSDNRSHPLCQPNMQGAFWCSLC